jgi:hypothetical protein
MPSARSELTNNQGAEAAPVLPVRKASPHGGPKPISNPPGFESILWILQMEVSM